jgi:AhpD family alkylhydroperoxidase
MSEIKLDQKEKELVAVGASVSGGCLRCCSYHFKRVFEEGATLEEVKKAVEDATSVIDSADEMMQRKAYSKMNIQREEIEQPLSNDSDQITALVKIGAAVASNCTTIINKHIEIAKSLEISVDQMTVAIKLAKAILTRAGEFADEAIADALKS